MSENPFSLNFGIEPNRMISRNNQIDEIVEGFKAASPSTYLYIITGVRGSGKTVTMASIMHRLKADKDWVTVSLNPNRDLLNGLAANLFENPMLKPAFVKADISFSLGVNVSLGVDAPEALRNRNVPRVGDVPVVEGAQAAACGLHDAEAR